jgi:hypothetical protein
MNSPENSSAALFLFCLTTVDSVRQQRQWMNAARGKKMRPCPTKRCSYSSKFLLR